MTVTAFDSVRILLVSFAMAGAIGGLYLMMHVTLHAIHATVKGQPLDNNERRAA